MVTDTNQAKLCLSPAPPLLWGSGQVTWPFCALFSCVCALLCIQAYFY